MVKNHRSKHRKLIYERCRGKTKTYRFINDKLHTENYISSRCKVKNCDNARIRCRRQKGRYNSFSCQQWSGKKCIIHTYPSQRHCPYCTCTIPKCHGRRYGVTEYCKAHLRIFIRRKINDTDAVGLIFEFVG